MSRSSVDVPPFDSRSSVTISFQPITWLEGLGFCDVAFQDFSRVDAEIRAEVAEVFDVSRSLIVLDWLERWIAAFLGEVDAATEAARRASEAPQAEEV